MVETPKETCPYFYLLLVQDRLLWSALEMTSND